MNTFAENLRIMLVVIALTGLALWLLPGCATVPAGYDADMTPSHDGEHWRTFETPAINTNTEEQP